MAILTPTFLALTLLLTASNAAPNQEFNLKMPAQCKEEGFCSIKPEGYDKMLEYVESLLAPTFIAQEKDLEIRVAEPKSEQLSPKKDWHNCPYREMTEELPYAYRQSNESEPEFIIQSKFLLQRIKTVKCANDYITTSTTEETSKECFNHVDFIKKSRCETLRVNRSLFVLDKTGTPMWKPFELDCCCVCRINRNL